MAIVMGTEVGPDTDIGVVIRQDVGQDTGLGTDQDKEAAIFMEEGRMVSEVRAHEHQQPIVLPQARLHGDLTSRTMCIQIEAETRISVIIMAAGNSGIINPATGKTTIGRIQEAGIVPVR